MNDRVLAITVAILLLHGAGALLAWPTLPEEIPVALDVDGEPVEWAAPSPWSWFGIPVLSALLVVAVRAAARWLGGRPLFLKPSSRRRFRQLAVDAQERVLAAIRETAEAAALPLALVFLLVHVGAYRAALGQGGMSWFLVGLLLSLVTFPALVLILPRRAEDALEREWRRAG